MHLLQLGQLQRVLRWVGLCRRQTAARKVASVFIWTCLSPPGTTEISFSLAWVASETLGGNFPCRVHRSRLPLRDDRQSATARAAWQQPAQARHRLQAKRRQGITEQAFLQEAAGMRRDAAAAMAASLLQPWLKTHDWN